MRTFRAFVWLRWRLLANMLKGGQRRDRFEQISRALQMVTPLLVVAMSVGSVLAITALGYFGGRALATELVAPPLMMRILRVSLLVPFGVIIFFSFWSPSQSSLSRYTRLLLLPISRRALHSVEFMAAATDPWILFLIPGLAMFAVGMAVGGHTVGAVVAAAGGLVFVGTLAGVASLIGFLVAWLFRSRRRSEMFTLVFIILLSMTSMLPVLFADSFDEPRQTVGEGESSTTSPQAGSFTEEDLERWFGWTDFLPTQLYVRTIESGFERNLPAAGLAMTFMAVQAVLLFVASASVHGRMIGAIEGERGRSKAGARSGVLWRLPLHNPVASAVAAAQVRTGFRTVRGRLAVLLPGPMLALSAMVLGVAGSDEARLAEAIRNNGHLVFGVGFLFAIVSFQAFTLNLFAADRSGLTMQFLQPVSDLDLARGKLTGLGVLLAVAAAFCLVSSAAVAWGGSIMLWIAALFGGIATYLWLGPVFVWLPDCCSRRSSRHRQGCWSSFQAASSGLRSGPWR
jgi:hypothetical protein